MRNGAIGVDDKPVAEGTDERYHGGASLFVSTDAARGDVSESGSRARKVSVSMPEDLSAAIQERVGRGEFSRYVTEAVARRLEQERLAELVAEYEAEHGPVPEELLAEAEASWPDAE